MIKYQTGGVYFFLNLFAIRETDGSVFPRAISVAAPCAFLCILFVCLLNDGDIRWVDSLRAPDAVTADNAVWSGFSFLVGFAIVFRTSQSYSRFWDGCTSTHQMRAEWFDACSSLMAFCRSSKADGHAVDNFQNILVRLFSMLHSAALAEIEDSNTPQLENVMSFHFELIDVEGIDATSLKAVKESEAKVELIFQWVQQLIVENITNGVLAIPAPILSRSFQEMSNGMVAFHDAMKLSQIPFPFPYAQTCDFLLWLHWLVVPFVVAQWCREPLWAGVFSFIQVFILWVLNFIAVELENPFGCDANDIDGREMQLEMNALLLLLMSPAARTIPRLSPHMKDLASPVLHRGSGVPIKGSCEGSKSFLQAWADIEVESHSTDIARRISVQQFRARRSRSSSVRSGGSTNVGVRSVGLGGESRSSVDYPQPCSGDSVSLSSCSNSNPCLDEPLPKNSAASRLPTVIEIVSATTETLDLQSPDPVHIVRENSDSPPEEPPRQVVPRVVIDPGTPVGVSAAKRQWRDEGNSGSGDPADLRVLNQNRPNLKTSSPETFGSSQQ